MDNLTHSLIGAVLGQAGLKRRTGLAMPALIIGANIPDIDAACFFWLEGTEHLGFRRGITHGPPAMVLLPLLLVCALWWFDRWQSGRGTRPEGRLPVNFRWLYLLSLIGTLSHPLFDWFNVYGIRLLEPFSSQWFHGDVLFIIDLWLWVLLGFGVWFSLRREKQGGDWVRPARIVIAVMVAYIGLNAGITAQAEAADLRREPYPVEAIASPVPLAFWQRERIVRLADGAWLSSAWKGKSASGGYAYSETGRCRMPDQAQLATGGSQAAAFMVWTQAPFAERAADGSVILRDARLYDPRARDRFSAALPQVKCVLLPAG
ncbi:MAG: metal-dependent hydrolase [Pseudomonadota bacterium]|nr:metal-dependent hydrolase [Pseudomonadota bacterium]